MIDSRFAVVRHFVAATAVVAILAYAGLYGRLGGPVPIQSDGYSYYVYLPSWFIYHDVSLDAIAQDVVRRHLPGLHRSSSVADDPALDEPASHRHRHPDVAVLRRRPSAHAVGRTCRPMGSRLTTSTRPGSPGLAYLLAGLALLRRMLAAPFHRRRRARDARLPSRGARTCSTTASSTAPSATRFRFSSSVPGCWSSNGGGTSPTAVPLADARDRRRADRARRGTRTRSSCWSCRCTA